MIKVTVYEVVADVNGPGPCGDGIETFRFRSRAEAEEFARGKTYYGKPATVQTVAVPRARAERWGVA